MNGTLRKQFDYFLAHHDELVRQFNGKVVVIVGERVEGAFDSELQALTAAQKTHKLGEFLLQRVTPGDEAYTQTFHSRVVFQ